MRVAPMLAVVSVFAAISLSPVDASACWDGVNIETERVFLMIGETEAGLDWPDADLEEAADALQAIDALLPAGDELHVEFGSVYFSAGSACADIDEVHSFAELLTAVAEACGRSPAELARARDRSATLYTVQLLSTTDEAAAQARADELNFDCRWHGFYERGGFPSINPCAEVEAATLADGRLVHRVVVGKFLSRASAQQVRASMLTELGHDGLVRRAG